MSEKLLPQNSMPRTFARTISRRAVLRGAGVVMALPWLESVRILGAPAPFPKRFGVMFMGCGINEDYWSASGDGAGMTLSTPTRVCMPLTSQRTSSQMTALCRSGRMPSGSILADHIIPRINSVNNPRPSTIR